MLRRNRIIFSRRFGVSPTWLSFDAPHELPDEPIVQRLQDRFQCTVVNTRRNKHQGTDIPNGIRTYSVIMRKDLPATMFCDPFSLQWCGEKM